MDAIKIQAGLDRNAGFTDNFFSRVKDVISRVNPFRKARKIEAIGRKSEILNSIYRLILTAETAEESIAYTIMEFKRCFTFTRVSITLFNFERGTFTPYGFGDKKGSVILQDGVSFPLEHFSNLDILQRHKTVLEQDLLKKETLTVLERNLMDEERLRSYFLCPLISKGELIGSLNFGSDLPNAFSAGTIRLCQEVANGIAVSLQQYALQEKVKSVNAILEKKEKDITDSIKYAKRIQQAKLPVWDQIKTCVPDCFVMFKPKDIVSGDFYFFRKVKGLVFVASADCTGHGVPGALMSMICSENLDEVVTQSSDPSAILGQLNKKIKYSLQQSHDAESTRDGMDIALCAIDAVNRIVKFAGANRPIWIVRSGSKEVEEIKGTKKAIGGFTDENQQFDTHWIKFHPGDTFYLATDGYADTFSEKDNKKLMTKRFKDVLVGIQDKCMDDQCQYLEGYIESWKGRAEQVDDILVIGIRL